MILRILLAILAAAALASCSSDMAIIRAAHWSGPAVHVESNSLGLGQLTGSPTIRFYLSLLDKDEFRALAPFLYGSLAKNDQVVFKAQNKFRFGTLYFSQGIESPSYQIPTAEVTYEIWSPSKGAPPEGFISASEAKNLLAEEKKKLGSFNIYSCGTASDFNGECDLKF